MQVNLCLGTVAGLYIGTTHFSEDPGAVGLVLPECRQGGSLHFLSRDLEQVSEEEDNASRGTEVPCVWHSAGPKEELRSRTNNVGQLISMYCLLQ